MEETKRIITLAGKNIVVVDKELDQRDLEFYAENPRVFTALQSLDESEPSQEQIQKIMMGQEHVKVLQQNIKAHGLKKLDSFIGPKNVQGNE